MITRIILAFLLALILSIAVAAANDCESLWAQLDDVLEDIDIGIDNINTTTAIVNAPDFDPHGPDGWLLDALPGMLADVDQDIAFSNQLGDLLKQQQCY